MCPGSSGVEQRTENPRVGSSNLPPGTTLFVIGHTEEQAIRKTPLSNLDQNTVKLIKRETAALLKA